PDMNISLTLHPSFFSDKLDTQRLSSCNVVTKGSGPYSEVSCDLTGANQMKINTADLVVLRQMAAGELLYTALATSYSVGSIDQLIKDHEGQELSTNQVIAKLSPVADSGKLTREQTLSSIRTLGIDLNQAFKWVLKYQNNLCRPQTPGFRRHHMVEDFCPYDNNHARSNLILLNNILSGTIQMDLDDEKTFSVSANLMALFDKPATDLRYLTPSKWDASGNALSLHDSSAGGLLPDHNASEVLQFLNQKK
ncbi:MAG: hypothetical protein AAGB31_13820, partial [Bdellovibrio sp.]